LAGLRPDDRLSPRYAGEVDHKIALLRAARPVVRYLTEQLGGEEVAVFLADRDGRVLGRWAHGCLLERLDHISASPGFIVDEATIGTSALGTSLEIGKPMVVLGTEHFVSSLDRLCSVGSPIRHPVTGRIEGAMDIVCPVGAGSTFMLPLITRVVREVEQRLLSGHAAADRALLDGFLRTERRGRKRPVLAVNSRLMVANTLAGDLLGDGVGGHATLWEQVRRALADGKTTIVIDPDAQPGPLQGFVHELRVDKELVGAVVQMHTAEVGLPAAAGTQSSTSDGDIQKELLGRLPGRSDTWRAVIQRSSNAVAPNYGRLLLVGPPGCGKAALATALLEARADLGNMVEFDGRDVLPGNVRRWVSNAETRCDGDGAWLLTHLDQLDPDGLEVLCHRLDELPAAGRLVIATYRTTEADADPPPQLLGQFENIVNMPALDDRREDIPNIVAAVLDDGQGLPVRVEPTALRHLMTRDWPANVRQLRRVILAARDECGSRTIRQKDIPDLFPASAALKRLTPLERVERDAIASALAAAGGNKRAAAAALAISRSTLYRKLEALGLDV